MVGARQWTVKPVVWSKLPSVADQVAWSPAGRRLKRRWPPEIEERRVRGLGPEAADKIGHVLCEERPELDVDLGGSGAVSADRDILAHRTAGQHDDGRREEHDPESFHGSTLSVRSDRVNSSPANLYGFTYAVRIAVQRGS